MTEDKLDYKIILGDVRTSYRELADQSVQTIVTSPPYWGLRDYDSKDQIGQELTPDLYIQNLVSIFKNLKSKLADDGTLWINIGDTYVGTGNKGNSKDPKHPNARNGQTIALNNKVEGLKPKDMIGIPWKLAFALQADGWYLRSDIIWERPNALPSPVKDRPVSSYEHVFLFSKSRTYFYDHEAVKEETVNGNGKRSLRDVWHINTKPLKSSHVAIFPKALVLPCVLAGSKKGDIVLDPFSGSGTSGLVALEQGRNYIGMENNEDYLEIAKDRYLEEKKEYYSNFTVISGH